MEKRKLFYKFLDYKARTNRGAYWISFVQTYIPIQKIIDYAWTFLSVKIAIENKSIWVIFGAIVGYIFLQTGMEFLKWGIATIDYKLGLWRAEIDWGAKNEKYNTYQIELMNTIKSIAEKVEAKNHFKELE